MPRKGFRLVNKDTNAIVNTWDDTLIPPHVIVLPNGDHVNAPQLGESYGPYMIEEIISDDLAPTQTKRMVPISRVQFFQQAAISMLITQDEAIAALKGTLPTSFETAISKITDQNQQFSIRMFLYGTPIFERNHPMTEKILGALGMVSPAIDDFFRSAAQLQR